MKYRNRRITILLFFEAVVRFGFRPINHIITKLWSTLIVGGFAPNWPIDIPHECEKDFAFYTELERVLVAGFDLKHAMENVPLPEKKGARSQPKLIVHKLPVIASPLRDINPARKMPNQPTRQGIRPSFRRK
jgi:hypothetical protein